MFLNMLFIQNVVFCVCLQKRLETIFTGQTKKLLVANKNDQFYNKDNDQNGNGTTHIK